MTCSERQVEEVRVIILIFKGWLWGKGVPVSMTCLGEEKFGFYDSFRGEAGAGDGGQGKVREASSILRFPLRPRDIFQFKFPSVPKSHTLGFNFLIPNGTEDLLSEELRVTLTQLQQGDVFNKNLAWIHFSAFPSPSS